MSDSGNGEKLTLAKRLRRDARTSRPEFSEELHRRMCRALWPSEIGSITVVRAVPERARAVRWLLAAAAACVLIVAGMAWRAGMLTPWADTPVAAVVAQQEPAAALPAPAVESSPLVAVAEPAELPADFEHVAALVDETAGQFNELVASAFAAPRFAYLDRDSVEGLAEHLPFALPFALAASEPVEDGE